MSKKTSALDDVIERALKLSALEKVRLIERMASVLRYEVESPRSRPRQSLRGILADLGPAPSEEDIAEARRDMFSGSAGDHRS